MRLVGESEVVASVDLPLRHSAVTIGTARGNSVVVLAGGVAAQHSRLRRQGRAWFIEDVRGSAGTYLNGIRVTAPQILRSGDHITVGAAGFHLVAEEADPARTTGQRPGSRKAWLGMSVATFVLLAAVVASVATMPERFATLGPLLPTTPTTEATVATTPLALATSPATATSAPSRTPTRIATATATASPTAEPTSAPTATVLPALGTLEAALAAAPADRAFAAMTVVAGMDPAARQESLATLSVASVDEALLWLDGLLGTATPEPPTGSIVLGLYSAGMERYDVVRHDLATGTETPLLALASQPSLNPSADTIAYRSWQADALGVYAATADGSQRWLLTREVHPEDGQPHWSADGASVAFASLRYGDGRSRIYVVPAGGGIATGICIGDYVAWAPDGRGIAFKGCIGGSCGIMLAAPDGSGQRLITSDASDGAPAWSSDGRFIAFHSTREGTWDIYVANADGSEVRRLTHGDTIETMPEWSRDGRYVAFRSNADGEWGIWAIPAGGGEPQKLFAANLRPGDEMVESFSWLP
ncbi:MAG: FHA domain-containing protein [Anaerolineae bacterium]